MKILLSAKNANAHKFLLTLINPKAMSLKEKIAVKPLGWKVEKVSDVPLTIDVQMAGSKRQPFNKLMQLSYANAMKQLIDYMGANCDDFIIEVS